MSSNNDAATATSSSSGTRWTRYTAWAWSAISLLTLAVFFFRFNGIDIGLRLLVVTFSSSFVIIAHSYRRFLVGNHDRPAESRANEIQAFTESRLVHVPEEKKEETAEELKAEFDSQYSIRAYTICVIPAVAISIVGWTLVLVPTSKLINAAAEIENDKNSESDDKNSEPEANPTLKQDKDAKAIDPAKPAVPGDDAASTPEGSKPPNAADPNTQPKQVATPPAGAPGTGQLAQGGKDQADGSDGGTSDGNKKGEVKGTNRVEKPLVIQAMGVGFLGALVFCFQLLWRRLITEDLKPSIFLRCAMAMFFGLIFTYVVFSATKSFSSGFGGDATTMTGTEALVGYIVAFSLGYFPMLAISWFTRVANKSLGEPSRRSDSQRLLAVDGVTVFHEERLLEEGIHTLHDLAYADVGRLLIRTPYTSRQLLDWVDQSLLLLYLDIGEAERFRRGGIRNAEDLLRAWRPLHDADPTDSRRGKHALVLQTTPERLDCIYAAIEKDRSA